MLKPRETFSEQRKKGARMKRTVLFLLLCAAGASAGAGVASAFPRGGSPPLEPPLPVGGPGAVDCEDCNFICVSSYRQCVDDASFSCVLHFQCASELSYCSSAEAHCFQVCHQNCR